MTPQPDRSSSHRSLTRRHFLKMLGAVGGSAAVFHAMDAWGLMVASGQEAPPPLSGRGNGVRVVILGAGPAGLTAAYELGRQGYDVRVLEARDRVGGHVWTIRKGAQSHEVGHERQVCDFDDGHFYEAGAWRIPYSHRATLYYCKHFNIPMQPHKNENLNAYLYMDNINGPLSGAKMRLRELRTDIEGYTAELLAKAVDQNQLDADLTGDDRQMLIDYLVNKGLISRNDLTYTGSHRRGYAEWPGAGMQPGSASEPFAFQDLLPYAAETMRTAGYYIASTASTYQQETMLQPVGGMLTIYEDGFLPALKGRIRFNAEVTQIRQDEDGVRIAYRDTQSDREREVQGDYCICTIPMSVLKDIPADFSRSMQEAIEQIPYASVGKMGLQFSRRFWEEDDWIYGGMSFTNISDIGTIAYPDYNYMSDKGVVQAYYNFGSTAERVGNLSLDRRIDLALRHGSKIHPQYRDEFETGFSVAWQNIPYSMGGWASYSSDAREQYYPRLLEPDGRIYLAGGHLSYVTSWQEGPISAAWLQIEKLHQRAMQNG